MEYFNTTGDYVYFFITLMVPIYFIYFIVYIFKEINSHYIASHWWDYYLSKEGAWNILFSVSLFLLFLTFIGRYILFTLPVKSTFELNNIEFPPLHDFAIITQVVNILNAISIVLCILSVFKYFSIFPRFNVLVRTIEHGIVSLVTVGFILFITTLSFSLSGWILFGYDFEGYKDVYTSFATLLRSIRADYGYFGVREINRDYSEIFFYLYQLFGIQKIKIRVCYHI
jgi:hypothetical protein